MLEFQRKIRLNIGVLVHDNVDIKAVFTVEDLYHQCKSI